MTVLKCKICGGDIKADSEKSFGLCNSCGSTVTLPKIYDEQKAGLFNRGNMLRMRGEFDKAAAVFERMMEQEETDAEAHWCLALCRHGIEYVEDPVSRELIPTCHRASYDSFFNDVDYIAAIEYSNSGTASLYTAEAKKIAKLQKEILAVSNQEEPFDLFLCYKETAENGSRTKDSALAQEIYYELTDAGYKVFFSRITLEDKLGSEYEPYIFAALNSAKVMVVVGTSSDNFNGAWVKNEWSRFLSLMKKERSRMLIPCYRDMDPYDLPDELGMLQSQDMSKIGFMQDIIRGIKKVLNSGIPTVKEITSSDPVLTASLERLVQNSSTYLKLKNYPPAQEVFVRITKEYPEDYRGWWGLIACATTNFTKVIDEQDTLNIWFGYVKQLANAEEFAVIESQYVNYVKIVAHSDADNEKIAMTKNIEGILVRIKTLQERREQVEFKRNQRWIEFENQEAEDNSIIYEMRAMADHEKKMLSKLKDRKRIGQFFCVLGVLLLLSGMAPSVGALFFGLVMIVFGINMMTAKKEGKTITDWQNSKVEVDLDLKYAEGKKETNREEYRKDIEALKELIRSINKEIAAAEFKQLKYQKYIEHGTEKIEEMFFALRCQAFGVKQTYDNETSELRKSAVS